MYKNQLQELAQRSCFNLPSYACIREGPDHAPRFKATVNFNGENFESPGFCTTLRQAEHSAAEVALSELSKRGPSRTLAAKVLDETGVYKNLLQETAHRAGLNLPVYTTVRSGPGHVPVFHSTVELAGLSFTGEPAKTKKQAQKNAAIAAWSVLKQLPHMQASSSSPGKLENERKDEQEQIIVARALAKLCPPDMKKSTVQNDRYHGRQRSAPIHQDMKPTSSGMHLYPMQYPSWSYQHYSPEMTMYPMWQPQQPYQQQNCLLTLPMAPSPPGPPILPLVHSLFQPDHAQYILARDKEPISVVAGTPASASTPSHILSNRAMPINVRSRSQVTIQEIQEERTQEGDDWPPSDSKSDGHKVKIESNSSVFPRFEVQNPPVSNKTIVEPLLLEKPHEDQKLCRSESTTGHSQPERNSNEQFKWSSQNPKDIAPGRVELLLGSSDGFDSSTSKLTHHSPRPSSEGVAKYCAKPSNAAPVRIKTVGASVSPVSPRPESLKTWMPTPPTFRTESPACSARPRLMRTGGMFSTNFMAPAVQIRSVVPVCSAPPSKMPESDQGLHSTSERNKESEDVTAASSELNKLQI
ncbi:Double-stranded rna-binding protein [Thalictrum thalictroides]|uniref:Double-stranded rna-binding protein n=1 Tax=Thalictrum thalictroides TaxID=46969 RepID=A0A7J6WXQ3_THATH|nr:Double-stranded rna-binding protein [Thalictrum thalictroides]